MDLRIIAEISQIVGGLALLISVLLLIHELRVNNRLVRAANTQTLVSLSSPFHLAMIQDRQMAEFYVGGAGNFAGMDEVDRYRYKQLVIWWLIFHENVYFQWKQGLLANRSFQPWMSDLRQFVKRQQLWNLWDELRGLFEKDFASHVWTLICECKPS